MKVCSNCGNKIIDDEKKCSICKTPSKSAIPVDENDKERIDEVVASVRASKSGSKPKKKSKILPIIIIAIIIGVIGSMLGGNEDSNKEPVQPAISSVDDPQGVEVEDVSEPEITVSAKEIIDTFEENEVRGKQTYTGKLAEITGVVGSVGEMLNQTYVTLGSGEDFEIIQLQCFFKDEDEVNKLAKLNKGDTITIIGIIGEQSLNIAVNNSVLK